jgi:protein-disulfide isomerase
MDERKSFFNSLEPKSALIVGLVTGLLSIGTLGFVIMSVMLMKGSLVRATSASSQFAYDAPSTPSTQTTPSTPAANAPIVTPTNIPKAKTPNVELFVMANCPFGLQAQKAMTPSMELLKNKANINVKFVSYIMHGAKEKDDNNVEYCIQKEQNDKYVPFLKCYTASGDTQGCVNQVGIDQKKMNNCIAAADKQFAINDEFNNKAHWLSGQYPIYKVHEDLNQKYGVEGSPTLVINGTKIEGVDRSPEAMKQAICASFENPPKECEQVLSATPASAGFGNQVGAAAPASAGCAT